MQMDVQLPNLTTTTMACLTTRFSLTTPHQCDVDPNGCSLFQKQSMRRRNGIPGSFSLAALALLAAVFVRRD